MLGTNGKDGWDMVVVDVNLCSCVKERNDEWVDKVDVDAVLKIRIGCGNAAVNRKRLGLFLLEQ